MQVQSGQCQEREIIYSLHYELYHVIWKSQVVSNLY